MIEAMNSRLELWGNYMRDSTHLGYPTSSIEHRMKNGCFGSGGSRASDGGIPTDIELTEFAVLKLPHDLQAAVTVAYTTGGTREDQARRLARRLGVRVSRDRFNRMIDSSHSRLAGYFDAISDFKLF